MKEKVLAFILKKMNWGKILPTLFRAIAEGQAGEGPKKVYWFLTGKKTFIGALLIGSPDGWLWIRIRALAF